MNIYVKTYNEIKGFHYWENAPAEVEFLKNRHRHTFHIITYFEVSGTDREIEIIMMERAIDKYLYTKYGKESARECEFNDMSCEMIAKEIVETFNAVKCEVNEDGKGGAIVVR